MKKVLFLLFVLTTNIFSIWAGVDNLLPKPKNVVTGIGQVSLQHIKIIDGGEISTEIKEWIEDECGGDFSIRQATSIQVKAVTEIEGAEFQEEAYRLTIKPGNILIESVTRQGAFWALQTLAQMADGTMGNKTVQVCAITDWPAFRARGYMQDVGRSYMEFDELKKEIKLLSRYKINLFHWHLTEYNGWRLETTLYPQLLEDRCYTRHPGKYYTKVQVKEMIQWAKKHGISIIPEIDMPGHSDPFNKAFGYDMQTTQGLATLKNLMTEACETFEGCEYMHIGTDEVTISMSNFVPEMVSHIRSHGFKVASWNPGYGYSSGGIDLIQMWTSRGAAYAGVPAIDSRYHYINHYDTFADIVGLYSSNIAKQQKGNDQYIGLIVGTWNDRILSSDEDILTNNGFYPAILAAAERSWMGGGNGYFETRGTMIAGKKTQEFTDFADWERRMLYHKHHHLEGEPFPYIKQTHMKWRITDAFPNNGNLNATFPPESGIQDKYTYNGTTYGTKDAIGAGIYLRHVWGTVIPAFYANPQPNHTAYAYTYVYSEAPKTVGMQLEFHNYCRSEYELKPPVGKWDHKGSRAWLNDNEILPQWEWLSNNSAGQDRNTSPLTNENFCKREPISVQLKAGWNKVFLKLPVGAFSTSETRLVKWKFTCAFVSLETGESDDSLIFSPDKSFTDEEIPDTPETPEEGPSTFLNLNGSDQYASIDSHADFNIATNESFTITAWVKANVYNSVAQRFVTKRWNSIPSSANVPLVDDRRTGYELWGALSGTGLYADNAPGTDGNHGNSLSDWGSKDMSMAGKWFHIAFVVDRNNNVMSLYYNGDQTKTSSGKTIAPWYVKNDFDTYLGAGLNNNHADYFLNGALANVRFYKKALSTEEIGTDMNTDKFADLSETIRNSSVAAYDFDNISGVTVPDISGHNHPATLFNYQPVEDAIIKFQQPASGGHFSVWNGDNELTDNAHVKVGTALNVKVTPESGYLLSKITINDKVISSNTFNAEAGEMIIAVEFIPEPEPAILSYEAPQNGTLTIVRDYDLTNYKGTNLENGSELNCGEYLTIITIPANGYELESLSIGDVIYKPENVDDVNGPFYHNDDNKPGYLAEWPVDNSVLIKSLFAKSTNISSSITGNPVAYLSGNDLIIKNATGYKANIYDLSGALMLQEIIKNNFTTISVVNLQQGSYILKLSGNEAHTFKLSK